MLLRVQSISLRLRMPWVVHIGTTPIELKTLFSEEKKNTAIFWLEAYSVAHVECSMNFFAATIPSSVWKYIRYVNEKNHHRRQLTTY